ncbi:hypothetical protein ACLD9W_03215 [Neisseria sp. WLZKY-1]|uniref:hypothetical protein n=1 Tax=Neisseria sp. WLZKY-1 TaxID=3390377 RepID=UPI00397B84C9
MQPLRPPAWRVSNRCAVGAADGGFRRPCRASGRLKKTGAEYRRSVRQADGLPLPHFGLRTDLSDGLTGIRPSENESLMKLKGRLKKTEGSIVVPCGRRAVCRCRVFG